jgi:putative addiction module CopG family antidote
MMQPTLSPQSVEVIQVLIKSGRYHDADEVIAEALLVLEEQERLAAFRAAVALGDEQIERGEVDLYTPELREKLMREAQQMAREGRKPHPDVCP